MILRLVRGRPIRQKLVLTIAVASVFGLVLAAAAVTAYDLTTFRPRARQDAAAQAALMRAVTIPALVFDDSSAASENLATLRARPEIAGARLYRPDGSLFAAYDRDPASAAPPPTLVEGTRFRPGYLELVERAVSDGQPVGWLVLRYRLPPLWQRVAQYGLIALLVMLALAAAAVLLFRVLGQTVTGPLLALADAARDVGRTGDVRVRVPRREGDEIGALTDAFNRMLDRLEEHQGHLRDSEARLRVALDAASMDTWVMDVSPRAAAAEAPRADRTSLDALVGRVHPEDRERVVQALTHARGDGAGAGFDVEFRASDADGGRWLALRGRLQPGAAGEPTQLIGVLQDVTHRRRLELQLLQSQKMEAIGTLAGGIAHDFNNLLTAMIGNLAFALRALPAESQVRTDVEEAVRAARRAASLTGQLLAYARRQMVVPTVVRLNRSVENMEPMLRRLLPEDIVIITTLEPALWTARVDAAQLEQVIMNLVVNARDAMPAGGSLGIATRNVALDEPALLEDAELPPGDYVALEVTDTGIGMTAATMAQIFEPFFTTKPVGQGTGLGLSMCFGVVKQSGGHIFVESQPGGGSRFTVVLPRFASGLPGGPKEEAGASDGADQLPGGSETILVVEDEPTVRELATRVLRSVGYRVFEANGGPAAREIVRQETGIDLVVADVVMPGENGPEVAEEIRRSNPGVRVLFMSGYPADALTPHHALPGHARLLIKPFTPDELAEIVRTVLDTAERSDRGKLA